MKIVRIFADEDCLLTVHYDNEKQDEFARLFNEWTDTEFLESFFTTHERDLDYWGDISVEDAIKNTRDEAIKFYDSLITLTKLKPQLRKRKFINLFKPLENDQSRFDYLDKKKAYGPGNKSWLRLFALKISDDMFLITGGAIKLTRTLQERDHTDKELSKIEICKRFLKNQGIIDDSGILEILETML